MKNKVNNNKTKGGNRSFRNGKDSKANYRGNTNGRASNSNGNARNSDLPRGADTAHNRVIGMKCNDPSWYIFNEQMARDVASLPVDYITGDSLKVTPSFRMPTTGILTHEFIPSIGKSLDKTSPVNVAAQALFNYIVHINSGSRTYEPADLMMYMVAMDSLYFAVEEAKRAYGACSVYNRVNKYYGRAITRALGWEFDDVSNNLNYFRTRINKLSARIANFPVPKGWTFSDRHVWMVSKLFRDSDSPNAQVYAYKMGGLYEWDGTTSTEGTMLKFVNREAFASNSAGTFTIDSYCNRVEAMIDALWNDSDISIISRDIFHTWQAAELVRLDMLAEDYIVIPEFLPEVCDQLRNLVCVPIDTANPQKISTDDPVFEGYGDTTGLDITQDAEGTIKWHPAVTMLDSAEIPNSVADVLGRVIFFHDGNTDPGSVFVNTAGITRFITGPSKNSDLTKVVQIESCRADIIVDTRIWYYSFDQDHGTYLNYMKYDQAQVNLNSSGVMGWVSGFRYRPTLFSFDTEEVFPLSDYDAFALIAPTNLDLIHVSALLKMFNVPVMGPYSSVDRIG